MARMVRIRIIDEPVAEDTTRIKGYVVRPREVLLEADLRALSDEALHRLRWRVEGECQRRQRRPAKGGA
jgi:hypothetical protein